MCIFPYIYNAICGTKLGTKMVENYYIPYYLKDKNIYKNIFEDSQLF